MSRRSSPHQPGGTKPPAVTTLAAAGIRAKRKPRKERNLP